MLFTMRSIAWLFATLNGVLAFNDGWGGSGPAKSYTKSVLRGVAAYPGGFSGSTLFPMLEDTTCTTVQQDRTGTVLVECDTGADLTTAGMRFGGEGAT